MLLGWVGSQGQFLVRTDVVRALGGYKDEFIPAEDKVLWLTLSYEERITLIPRVVHVYRSHDGQRPPPDLADIERRLRRRYIDGLTGRSRAKAERLDRAHLSLQQAFADLLSSNYARSLRNYRTAARLAPEAVRSPLIAPLLFGGAGRAAAGLIAGPTFLSGLRRIRERAGQFM